MATTVDDVEPPDIPTGPIDLETLVQEISKQLHAADTVHLSARNKLKSLLGQLDMSLGELNRYAFYDPAKKYTRNLIACDDKFTLMLLCWNADRASPIHDHPCQGCWMRVAWGTLQESRYALDRETNTVVPTTTSVGVAGDVIYIDDSLGLHKVAALGGKPAASLHLYSPQYKSCRIWLDGAPADGALRPIVTYHSEYGALVSYEKVEASALCDGSASGSDASPTGGAGAP